MDVLALPVNSLPGIGPMRTRVLGEQGVRTVGDLLRFFPRRYLDRSRIPKIAELTAGDPPAGEVTIIGTVIRARSVPGRKRRSIVTLSDGTGSVECLWFTDSDWVTRTFAPGDEVAASGALKRFRGWQMTHPEVETLSGKPGEESDGDGPDDNLPGGETDLLHTGRIIPLYPGRGGLAATGLHSRGLRRIIRRTLDRYAGKIVDPVPAAVYARHDLLALPAALRATHFPESFAQAEAARHRLAFDEFFGLELALARRRQERLRMESGIAFADVGARFERLLGRLPFSLTDGQKQVLREIRRDMRRPAPMSRLLQGDVGAGKTLVALFAAVMAADNGWQTAIMAPTEVLAEQHALTIGRLLFEVGLDSVLITGSTPAAQRRRALGEVASGQVDIVIGTHALLSGDVAFRRLGLVVVDEQHRFGVVQREALRRKASDGRIPDLLVMTATPIPRSLAQTLYGDLDVSVLAEKPPGRQPIRTVLLSPRQAPKAWEDMREKIARGEQGYVIYPIIERSETIDQSETLDLRAATEGYEFLRAGPFAGRRVGLLHGRMTAAERDRIMQEFKAGALDVLVATTVIEVGVDVPNATAMAIEGAERFGLAQLHQLRGRIGRGTRPSTCWLIPGGKLTDESRERLEAIAASDDGFRLAEVDLALRGPGEFFGTRQSGMPELRIGHIVRDAKILAAAREEAFALVDGDPNLELPAHAGLRRLAAPYERALAEADRQAVA